jgi:hypothetical protein
VLEVRALLDDGIIATPGAALNAVAGVPITGAVLATFTISYPAGEPGTKWRARTYYGDGQADRQVAPISVGNRFAFIGTHTYTAPGTWSWEKVKTRLRGCPHCVRPSSVRGGGRFGHSPTWPRRS